MSAAWEALFGGGHTPLTSKSKDGVSKRFPNGLRYRVSPWITNGKSQKVRWCWTTTRNADGYFVGFREVRYAKRQKNGADGFRDQYRARKARWRVRHWALSQYNKSPYRDGPPYLPNRETGRL